MLFRDDLIDPGPPLILDRARIDGKGVSVVNGPDKSAAFLDSQSPLPLESLYIYEETLPTE
jgi:hypothetical protein